ncbi:MAG: ribonuclease HII [Bacteroidota bacterium]
MLKPHYTTQRVEAGCDEVGRGCLAGPVVAAAVILPRDYHHPLLKDSKQIAPAQRLLLSTIIREVALAWAIGQASPAEIDRLNILHASHLAMHRAITLLKHAPELLLIDGNRFRSYKGIPHVCIVQGDAQFSAIAAASVLAKTHRDAYMHTLAAQYPGYHWDKNVGYPTPAHRHAIQQLGITLHHRKTFRLAASNLASPTNQPLNHTQGPRPTNDTQAS